MKRLGLLGIWLVCMAASPLILWRMLWSIGTNPGKAFAIAVAIDRSGNAAANGENTETISDRANEARIAGRAWGCILCRFLDWLQKGHCENSTGT